MKKAACQGCSSPDAYKSKYSTHPYNFIAHIFAIICLSRREEFFCWKINKIQDRNCMKDSRKVIYARSMGYLTPAYYKLAGLWRASGPGRVFLMGFSLKHNKRKSKVPATCSCIIFTNPVHFAWEATGRLSFT